ncbi:50S ribosomal protein L25 [Maridesulfovibrio ferrireducens]|uniref:50S ribosomal protein L25 n=1 Tax=Maridesulfovibrio ferrireducens TaxID=246191 RepID=UPI001A2A79DA|nr:50S ribosomal protein L25 [Maridesulfovibrio ferrireducens]MBI9112394.1 50S ribosomal protein L25 [Maridesulfovibrio ferrireducens]
MSEKETFVAVKREKTGTSANRQLRNTGMIPAVFYSQEGDNMVLAVNEIDFTKMYRKIGTTSLFNLEIDGKKHDTLIWKAQMDPVRPRINHVDFLGVAADKPLKIKVPVSMEGLAPGVKLGGCMTTYRDNLEVACTAANIPAKIVINIDGMNVNDTVFVSDVKLEDGASINFTNDFALVRCVAGRKVVDEDGTAEEGAPKK